MANLYKKVRVADSRIPGAGKGLFAAVAIKSGYPICIYEGEILDDDEFEERYENEVPEYAVPFPGEDQLTIDPRDMPEALGRYANASDKPGNPLTANAKLQANKKEAALYLVAIKNIKVGDEILFAYGPGFWDKQGEYVDVSDYDDEEESLGSQMTDDSEFE